MNQVGRQVIDYGPFCWYDNWSEHDLQDEVDRFKHILNSPSRKKYSLTRRARYAKRLQEAHAALLALRLAK